MADHDQARAWFLFPPTPTHIAEAEKERIISLLQLIKEFTAGKVVTTQQYVKQHDGLRNVNNIDIKIQFLMTFMMPSYFLYHGGNTILIYNKI